MQCLPAKYMQRKKFSTVQDGLESIRVQPACRFIQLGKFQAATSTHGIMPTTVLRFTSELVATYEVEAEDIISLKT